MTSADYMRICFAMIDTADCLYMLDGWENSPGACLEKMYADYIGKTVIFEKAYAAYIDKAGATTRREK